MSTNILNYKEVPGLMGALSNSQETKGASRIGESLRLWAYRWQMRRELSQILGRDDRFFKDIGVSRAAVLAESDKGFWRA